jgi:hypothetical protein
MAVLIGQTHPVANQLKGMQNYVAQFNSSFFDGLYYLQHPTPAQKATWKSAALSYGVYTEASIPFLLIEFVKEKWNFVMPLNILAANSDDREEFMSSKDSVLNLFMVNADSNITEQIRTLKADATFAAKVRQTCAEQLKNYQTATDVSNAVQQILKNKNYALMKPVAYMVNILTI